MADYLHVSNGSGIPVTAIVTTDRGVGSTQLIVDSVLNWPQFGIAQSGTRNPITGIISNKSVFYYHLDGSIITIESYGAGYHDIGNVHDQVVILKPTSEWANSLVDKVLSFGASILTAMQKAVYDPANISEQLLGLTATQSPKNKTFDNTSPTAYRFPGEITTYAARNAPTGWLRLDGSAVSRTTYAALFATLNTDMGAFTITVASPGVVTKTAHGFSTGDQVYLTTTGALPTGLAANTLYYVIRVDANTFRLATTRANAYASTAINTTGTQSGTHTLIDSPYGLGDGSTTFTLPDGRGRNLAGMDVLAGTAAGRLSLAQSQGVYGNLGANGGEQGHQLTVAELANHNHDHYEWLFNGAGSSGAHYGFGYQLNTGALNSTASYATSGEVQFGNAPTGGNGPHNNVQPTLLVNYIIKT